MSCVCLWHALAMFHSRSLTRLSACHPTAALFDSAVGRRWWVVEASAGAGSLPSGSVSCLPASSGAPALNAPPRRGPAGFWTSPAHEPICKLTAHKLRCFGSNFLGSCLYFERCHAGLVLRRASGALRQRLPPEPCVRLSSKSRPPRFGSLCTSRATNWPPA